MSTEIDSGIIGEDARVSLNDGRNKIDVIGRDWGRNVYKCYFFYFARFELIAIINV